MVVLGQLILPLLQRHPKWLNETLVLPVLTKTDKQDEENLIYWLIQVQSCYLYFLLPGHMSN